jgi:hypothetical protein
MKDSGAGSLFRQPALLRTAVLWAGMMTLMMVTFGVGVITHPEVWTGVSARETTGGWSLLGTALLHNMLIVLLIGLGNLFVRFSWFTPGLLILIIQALIIGWTAGTNAFADPFPSVAAANAAFLRIGLWETSAYAVVCGVTLTKSRLIADTLPATAWEAQRPLRTLTFTRSERRLLVIGLVMLIGAAVTEAGWCYQPGDCALPCTSSPSRLPAAGDRQIPRLALNVDRTLPFGRKEGRADCQSALPYSRTAREYPTTSFEQRIRTASS